jgi:hypothetical protein
MGRSLLALLLLFSCNVLVWKCDRTAIDYLIVRKLKDSSVECHYFSAIAYLDFRKTLKVTNF